MYDWLRCKMTMRCKKNPTPKLQTHSNKYTTSKHFDRCHYTKVSCCPTERKKFRGFLTKISFWQIFYLRLGFLAVTLHMLWIILIISYYPGYNSYNRTEKNQIETTVSTVLHSSTSVVCLFFMSLSYIIQPFYPIILLVK